jgi:late competence protein required for DNA uptake (superfamily II DNA/RNA helicase)
VGKGKGEIMQQLSRLKANIQCDYCSKQLKNPVTNIPCGHSYCQECKAGYLKECKKCSGVKREAVYRNELLDEVIQAASLVEKIVTLINA